MNKYPISSMTQRLVQMLLACAISACSAKDGASADSIAEQLPTPAGCEIMKIRLTINSQTTTATLENNASARDFLAMLPITLKLDDYNATEKIAYLPHKLTTQDAPDGITPTVGDITYYAPWGNVALFYRDFGYSPGLIRLGRFDVGVDAIAVPGPLQISIEAIRP